MGARKARSARRSGARGWGGGRAAGPGRLLAVLAVVIAALYITMFATGTTTPRLAIDLAGGTSVVFTAAPEKGSSVTSGAMDTAVSIMQERANGYGVTDAQVTQQGNNTIQVEMPGQNSEQEVASLGKTALLYFRPVLTESGPPTPTASGSPSASPKASSSASASASASSTSTTSASAPSASASASASSTATTDAESMAVVKDAASASASASAAATGTATASPAAASASASASPSPSPTSSAAAAASASESTAETAFGSLDCTNAKQAGEAAKAAVAAGPTDYVSVCDSSGDKYLLGPSLVAGTDVTGAQAEPVTAQGTATGAWQIVLTFNSAGSKAFATATQQLYTEYQQNQGGQFAIVLDGTVLSAPVVNQGAITGGTAQITGGDITQSSAQQLATQLQYGALPLTFNQTQLSIVSPTLGGAELSGGLIAGAIGIVLVFAYVIMYYRGLSVVAISSLLIASSLTYAFAVLLGPLIGFTLSLEGIAGLIVAIGITADSFVVFFERLRDEVREGRTLRTAVEHGWTRARRTIVASDLVSILAAGVLYFMSIGTVKGFAFTLGLTTVIDLVVVFLFTKPMVTLLAQTEFYGGGHKWSGLDPDRLGGKRVEWTAPAAVSADGRRMTIAERRAAAERAAGGDDDAEQADVVDSDETKRVDV